MICCSIHLFRHLTIAAVLAQCRKSSDKVHATRWDHKAERSTAVGDKQSRSYARRAGGGRHLSRNTTEDRVADGQAAQEDPEHHGGRFGVGTEQGSQVPLPRDLIHQATEAREHSENQSHVSNHAIYSQGQTFSNTPGLDWGPTIERAPGMRRMPKEGQHGARIR